MKNFLLKSDQKPTKEIIERLSELKEEDIVYDDDCPQMTLNMQEALVSSIAQKKRFKEMS